MLKGSARHTFSSANGVCLTQFGKNDAFHTSLHIRDHDLFGIACWRFLVKAKLDILIRWALSLWIIVSCKLVACTCKKGMHSINGDQFCIPHCVPLRISFVFSFKISPDSSLYRIEFKHLPYILAVNPRLGPSFAIFLSKFEIFKLIFFNENIFQSQFFFFS